MANSILVNRNRTENLIAYFENGYAIDWVFKVNEAFKDALDIKCFERKKNGVLKLVWTQGYIYSFQKGDVLLDYINLNNTNETWEETLKHLNYSIQVVSASPCFIEASGGGEDHESDVKNQGKKKGKKKYILDHGYVKFNIFIPNKERTAVYCKETRECTQVEFVKLLKNGLLEEKDKEVIQEELFFS